MNATPKVVLSKTLEGLAWENSTLARGDILGEIDRLKRQSGGDIVVFGGVRTVRSLVGLGVIDEYRLRVSPVAVGRGGSVFGDITAPLKLKLLSAQAFASGTVAVYYGT
jgi:dihydrofolate reductase